MKIAQSLSKRRYSTKEAARFIRALLRTTRSSSPQLAREIGVASQTVNRWVRGTTSPRSGQIRKILALMENDLGMPLKSEKHSNILGDKMVHLPKTFDSLGIHFSESIMALEAEAREVWVIKCGALREATRGFMGEAVLRALKNGVHFHYIFLTDSEAERTFVHQLKPWLATQKFSGIVTGYNVKDATHATTIGITQAPGAWIVIEYSQHQMQSLKRSFDVFKALPVREYMDDTRREIKNEDGQPCWIELATSRASALMERLSDLRSMTMKGSLPEIEILRIRSRKI
jgi:transcriptional regulator with XRE-family HTH domain